MIRNEMPDAPLNDLLGARFVDAAEGSLVAALPASPWLCSRSSEVAPGVLAALLHYVLSGPPVTLRTGGQHLGIINQSLTFLRPVPPDGRELLAHGGIVHRGSELLVSTAEVVDADGNQVALGSQTSVLIERRRSATPQARQTERILATVLFTDIVGSTRRAQQLGDDRWRELLSEHDTVVRRQLQAFKGREIKTIGDGFLAAFESPARAVHCARAIREGVRTLGLEIRAGIHTGECERMGADLAGIAVHAASRIESAAAPGDILVSSTVHDLVAGSGIAFVDRGLHELKDIGKRQLFAVER